MGSIIAVLFAAMVGNTAGVTPNDDGQNIYKFDEAKQEFVLIENPSQELIDLHEAARLQSDKDDGPVVMEEDSVMETVVSTTVEETTTDTTPSGPPAGAAAGPTSGDLNALAG